MRVELYDRAVYDLPDFHLKANFHELVIIGKFVCQIFPILHKFCVRDRYVRLSLQHDTHGGCRSAHHLVHRLRHCAQMQIAQIHLGKVSPAVTAHHQVCNRLGILFFQHQDTASLHAFHIIHLHKDLLGRYILGIFTLLYNLHSGRCDIDSLPHQHTECRCRTAKTNI